MNTPVERFCFCEACGQSIPMPKIKTVHLLCCACNHQPRQWPANTETKPATFRELLGLREDPRNRMIGETWT